MVFLLNVQASNLYELTLDLCSQGVENESKDCQDMKIDRTVEKMTSKLSDSTTSVRLRKTKQSSSKSRVSCVCSYGLGVVQLLVICNVMFLD